MVRHLYTKELYEKKKTQRKKSEKNFKVTKNDKNTI